MKFIDILNMLLMESGVSRNKFCADLEIGKNSVANWELRGNTPDGEVLAKIAAYFNVSTDYLLGVEKPAALDGQPSSELTTKLTDKIARLAPEDAEKALEYVEMLEMKRKHQEP